ncbi:HD-GYP domain-containing protein [Kribbella sp. NBC_01245]|uniref:HD-GYP domain-containing protein n=1 Tax=Kribbella sp. NBC_01245 TaxID=2903578 RepID=UPI002E2C307B|nr:HD-GYP domain-containing protein [Kribbella sp. NBC_01245]
MTEANHRTALHIAVAASSLAAISALLVSVPHLTDYWTLVQLCVVVIAATRLRFPHGPASGASVASLVLVSVFVVAGPAAAVVVAAIGALFQARGVPPVKRMFNASQRTLSAGAGGLAYVLVGGPVGNAALDDLLRTVLAVTVGGIVHQIVNVLLVCIVMTLERGPQVAVELLKGVLPTVLPNLGYRYLGLLMAVVWMGGLGILAGVLAIVPLLVARWAYTQDEAERKAQAATMRAFIQVIETKDLYTRGHSERVSHGVGLLGRHLKLSAHRQHALEHAGLLHDVGKVGVPTRVIQKPGKLDDSEMDAIRLHPARGVELIGDIPFLEEVKSAVLHHHEKYDGTGYPAGLSGPNIPYFARMIGIVDAFDSLTSTRSYRPARSVDETLDILVHDRFTHFDPELVDSFVSVIKAEGWHPSTADQPVPDAAVEATVDHDDLSLGSGGGATGSAAGPT